MSRIPTSSIPFGLYLCLMVLLVFSLPGPFLLAQDQEEEEEKSQPGSKVNQATTVEPEGEFNPWDTDGVMAPQADVIATPFRHLYLSGKVVLEDGTQPPDRARIELICSNEIQPQAISEEDGSFNFRVSHDRNREIVNSSADRALPGTPVGATGYGGVGSRPAYINMSDCEVRAALGGYQSSKVRLGRRSVFESADIGPIILYPQARGQQLQLDRLDSARALKFYKKGKKELFKKKPNLERASEELAKAVEADPHFSDAWNLLGQARIQMDELEGAREALRQATVVDPDWPTPCVTLALLELKTGRVAEAAVVSEHAIELAPDLVEARYYHGLANTHLGNLEKAKTSLDFVLKSPTAEQFPRTHYLLGVILAQSGQLARAVSHFRDYLKLEPDSKVAETVRQQLQDWESAGVI